MTGGNQYTVLNKLGSGSYGDVYEVVDQLNNKWAIKQILRGKDGIPCLLEAVIMASIEHPSINKATKILNTDKHLNIIQRKAKSDLAKHTQRKVLPIELVRKWLHMVTQGLSCLHYLGLIHADIKAGNVLYFSDDEVCLADFTLTTKKWTGDDTFTHPACTYSHCPPEILRGDPWNDRIDIWALACLYYEVAFGELLFPAQSKIEDKLELKRRYYNSIAEWCGKTLLGSHKHNPVRIHPCYNTDEYTVLRNLIESMIIFDWHRRPDINTILDHQFFTGLTKMPAELKSAQYELLPEEAEKRLEESVKKVLKPMVSIVGEDDTYYIRKIACETFKRSHKLSSAAKLGDIDITVVASCWIAGKVVCGDSPVLATSIPNSAILKAELELCTFLSYCVPFMV
jgi:serine/threonine protein kinase